MGQSSSLPSPRFPSASSSGPSGGSSSWSTKSPVGRGQGLSATPLETSAPPCPQPTPQDPQLWGVGADLGCPSHRRPRGSRPHAPLLAPPPPRAPPAGALLATAAPGGHQPSVTPTMPKGRGTEVPKCPLPGATSPVGAAASSTPPSAPSAPSSRRPPNLGGETLGMLGTPQMPPREDVASRQGAKGAMGCAQGVPLTRKGWTFPLGSSAVAAVVVWGKQRGLKVLKGQRCQPHRPSWGHQPGWQHSAGITTAWLSSLEPPPTPQRCPQQATSQG